MYRNVAFGLEIRKRPKAEIRKRVIELLELVHLEQFADRYPAQLSGGQRQRMALARALAVEPEVLLLDEPFGALDAQVRKELRTWLRRLHDEVHVTTVFVTHDQEEAMEVADSIVVLAGGEVEQVGSPHELYDNPANEFVMSFLGPVTELGGQLVRPHDVELTPITRAGRHAGHRHPRGAARLRGPGRGAQRRQRGLGADQPRGGRRVGPLPRRHRVLHPGTAGQDAGGRSAATGDRGGLTRSCPSSQGAGPDPRRYRRGSTTRCGRWWRWPRWRRTW